MLKRLARCIVLLLPSMAVLLFTHTAMATGPPLTPKPKLATLEACASWASRQDDDAVYMWGTQEDGSHRRALALERLTRSCMGGRPPEIVNFGSSAGFDLTYCRKHPAAAKLCKDVPR